MAMKAKEGCCEEAVMGIPGYFPCNEPATHRVTFRSGETARHCEACTDHAVRNRGAEAEVYKL